MGLNRIAILANCTEIVIHMVKTLFIIKICTTVVIPLAATVRHNNLYLS